MIPVHQKNAFELVRYREVCGIRFMFFFCGDLSGHVFGLAQLKVVKPSLRVELLSFNALAGMILDDFDFSWNGSIKIQYAISVVSIEYKL